jgi:hypothetical protein
VAEEMGALSAVLAGGVGEGGDDGTDAGMGFEESLVDEVGDYLVGGVGVDVELAAQGADGGEGIAGAKLAGDDGLLRSVDDLLEEGNTNAKWDPERNHVCTITCSTPKREEKFLMGGEVGNEAIGAGYNQRSCVCRVLSNGMVFNLTYERNRGGLL